MGLAAELIQEGAAAPCLMLMDKLLSDWHLLKCWNKLPVEVGNVGL